MYNIRRKAKVEMRKYSREKLNYMHDEELSRSYRNKNASIPETEMCYIQRELESRKNRKIAHRAYLANKTRRF